MPKRFFRWSYWRHAYKEISFWILVLFVVFGIISAMLFVGNQHRSKENRHLVVSLRQDFKDGFLLGCKRDKRTRTGVRNFLYYFERVALQNRGKPISNAQKVLITNFFNNSRAFVHDINCQKQLKEVLKTRPITSGANSTAKPPQ